MADWRELPDGILGEIMLKLDNLEDVVYFSNVCHSWYDAYSIVKKRWTARMPWLMLAETTKDNPNHFRKIYCHMRERTFQFKIPETFGARCWGSPCGWVVTFDLNLELQLFNPITRARLRLPPQSTMYQEEYGEVNDNEMKRRIFMSRVLVFIDDESDNDDIIVIAIHCAQYGHLAYARPCDKTWTLFITSEINKGSTNLIGRARAHDVVRHGSQLLILFYNGVLGYCDMSALRDSQPVKVMEYLPAPSPSSNILNSLFKDNYMMYLVESFGDVFVILRYKDGVDPNDPDENDPTLCYRTSFFETYKINLDAKKWEEVEDLGDVAFFVGNNSSMSFHVHAGMNNCRRNCIYFNDDEWDFWTEPSLFGGHDIGIYDMEIGEVEPVYEGEDKNSVFCPPFWFKPNLF